MKWNKDHFLSEYISIRTVCVWGGGVGGAVLFSVENRWCVKYDISNGKKTSIMNISRYLMSSCQKP